MARVYDKLELTCKACGFYFIGSPLSYNIEAVNEMHAKWHQYSKDLHKKGNK